MNSTYKYIRYSRQSNYAAGVIPTTLTAILLASKSDFANTPTRRSDVHIGEGHSFCRIAFPNQLHQRLRHQQDFDASEGKTTISVIFQNKSNFRGIKMRADHSVSCPREGG